MSLDAGLSNNKTIKNYLESSDGVCYDWTA